MQDNIAFMKDPAAGSQGAGRRGSGTGDLPLYAPDPHHGLIGSRTGGVVTDSGPGTGSMIRRVGITGFIPFPGIPLEARRHHNQFDGVAQLRLSLVPQMIFALWITPCSSCTLAWGWIYSRI